MDKVFVLLTTYLSDRDRCAISSCCAELHRLHKAYCPGKPLGLRQCMFCPAKTRTQLKGVGVGCCARCFDAHKHRIAEDFDLPVYTIARTT